MIRWLIFCPHGQMLRRLAQGWRYAGDLGDTHGQWSVLMEWAGEGEPNE